MLENAYSREGRSVDAFWKLKFNFRRLSGRGAIVWDVENQNLILIGFYGVRTELHVGTGSGNPDGSDQAGQKSYLLYIRHLHSP